MKIDKTDLAFGFLFTFLLGSGLVYISETSLPQYKLTPSDINNKDAKQNLKYFDFSSKEQKEIKIKKNDTLYNIFNRLGLDSIESQSAVDAFGKLMNTKHIGPGHNLIAYFDNGSQGEKLIGISFQPNKEKKFLLSRISTTDWEGQEIKTNLINKIDYASGYVNETLYDSIISQGADNQVVHNYADIFGYDIDFQREIQKGDQFEIVYEKFENDQKEFVKTGNILYASFRGHEFSKILYRFQSSNDSVSDYYDATGKSVKRFIMKTPINGARLSSNFGMRFHPILGYTKAHNGTDFAAPVGTPVYAGGDGIVIQSNFTNGYGNYIKIQHNTEFTTAYAHLSRFENNIRPGARVHQGQVIGYVGMTGRTTGPHLHYEVYRYEKPINGSLLKASGVKSLNGKELKDFLVERNRIESLRHKETEIKNYSATYKIKMASQSF